MTNEVINLTTYYYKKAEIDSLLNQKIDKSDITDAVEENNLYPISSQGVFNALQDINLDGNAIIKKINNDLEVLQIFKQDDEVTIDPNIIMGMDQIRFDLFLERDTDIYISCYFKQTTVRSSYNCGLVVSTNMPKAIAIAGSSSNAYGSMMMCAGVTYRSYYGDKLRKFIGVNGSIDTENVLDEWYKLEVFHIGNTITSIITDSNDEIILNQSKDYPSNYKYWSFYALGNQATLYKDVFIGVPFISSNNVQNMIDNTIGDFWHDMAS